MKCSKIKIKKRGVCIGDLNRKIILNIRSITPPSDFDSFDYEQAITTPVTVWAAVQTLSGKEIFDGVNVLGVATHVFYIKYKSGLTSESFIRYNSEYYRIIRLENLDENNLFMALYCNVRGATSIGVNQQ